MANPCCCHYNVRLYDDQGRTVWTRKYGGIWSDAEPTCVIVGADNVYAAGPRVTGTHPNGDPVAYNLRAWTRRGGKPLWFVDVLWPSGAYAGDPIDTIVDMDMVRDDILWCLANEVIDGNGDPVHAIVLNANLGGAYSFELVTGDANLVQFWLADMSGSANVYRSYATRIAVDFDEATAYVIQQVGYDGGHAVDVTFEGEYKSIATNKQTATPVFCAGESNHELQGDLGIHVLVRDSDSRDNSVSLCAMTGVAIDSVAAYAVGTPLLTDVVLDGAVPSTARIFKLSHDLATISWALNGFPNGQISLSAGKLALGLSGGMNESGEPLPSVGSLNSSGDLLWLHQHNDVNRIFISDDGYVATAGSNGIRGRDETDFLTSLT